MENLKIIKTLFPYILISALVSAGIGLTIPRGLFISGGVIILVLVIRIYTKGEERLFVSDILYAGSIISTVGIALILIYGTCILVPHLTSCAPNSFRATAFAIIYFTLGFGCILWITLRLPMIIKAMVKKR